jgi:uncharacterized protein (DUF3084 family)
MSSVRSGNAEEWSEAQKARFKSERETLNKRMNAFNRMMDEFETDKKQLKASLEQEKDPELDMDFPRMVERGIRRITNKQGELIKRREELTKRMKELDAEEQQLNALLGHERYPEWLELRKRRDEAVEVVARLEAEMKRLMESIIVDTSMK